MSKELIQEMLDSARDLIQAARDVASGLGVECVDEPKAKKEEVTQEKTPPKIQSFENEFQVKPVESKKPVWSGNKFEDMGDIEIEKPEGYDKIKDDIKPTKRNRRAYSTIDIECTSCHKQVSINPIFKKDIFVCDRCVSKRYGKGS